jgi:DNA repair protein RAD7
MASSSDPGFLCHPCAKAGGNDPFKKPAAPRKRKTPAERRTVVHIEERSFPTLVSICIDVSAQLHDTHRHPQLLQVIARHIDDVEAFGDIGALNMDAISKALSKNRSLCVYSSHSETSTKLVLRNSENATLFYGAENTKLALYDATSKLLKISNICTSPTPTQISHRMGSRRLATSTRI